jgi:hypothetical protein
MDLYSSNTCISFMKPEMLNLLLYEKRFPNITEIEHANVIDIWPDIERISIIAEHIASIECLADQLPHVKQAKILTVYSEPADTIEIDNTITKLIIVFGDVLNIKLTLDDPETTVYHRVFSITDETGLKVGDRIENLLPRYHLFNNSIPFPEVFENPIVKQAKIAYAIDRQALRDGSGFSYILDTTQGINGFKGATIVAIRNCSLFKPEILKNKNLLIVNGNPESFNHLIEEPFASSEILMADMSQESIKSFIDHKDIKGYDFSNPTLNIERGFSTLEDYSKGISPARHLLIRRCPKELLDEIVFKIDNPFTFAYPKKRDSNRYNLMIYSLMRNPENTENTSEKISILYASKKSIATDIFNEMRQKELLKLAQLIKPFCREYPNINPFSTKRNLIRSDNFGNFDDLKNGRRNLITNGGSYEFQDCHNLCIWNQDANSDIYLKNCGFVMIHNNDSSFKCRIHIVGCVHSIIVNPSCEIICYFKRKHNPIDYLLCQHDDISLFSDEIEDDYIIDQFEECVIPSIALTRSPAIKSSILTFIPETTNIQRVFCVGEQIKRRLLANIERIIEIDIIPT